MKRLEIYLDPDLPKGYSGGDVFTCAQGTVSLVWTNHGKAVPVSMIVVRLSPVSNQRLEVQIVGGPMYVAGWKAIGNNEEARVNFMYSMFFRGATPEILTDFIHNALEVGEETGRDKVRRSIKTCLGISESYWERRDSDNES